MTTTTTTTLAERVELDRWPTADEVAGPICAALSRLADLDVVADQIANHIGSGKTDPDSIAVARAYVHLVNEIARRCRAVADSCTMSGKGVAGVAMDSVVRLITDDRAVVTELHYIEHPLN